MERILKIPNDTLSEPERWGQLKNIIRRAGALQSAPTTDYSVG